jgi:hypothetical protein
MRNNVCVKGYLLWYVKKYVLRYVYKRWLIFLGG